MLDLYEIFGNDESFKTKILIDAPLGHRISNIIHRAIDDRDVKKQEKFQTYKKMMVTCEMPKMRSISRKLRPSK
jgi:hypothetical protein